MTYDVILPETVQEHNVPLIPTHNIIYKKIFNAIPVIHNYKRGKMYSNWTKIFQTLFSFFLYNNDSDIHLLQTHKNPLLQV